MNKDETILIVGLGLMGGSYARGLTKAGFNVIALDKNKESIDYALANGIIKEGTSESTEEFLSKADYVIITLYPTEIVKWIENNQDKLKGNAIITDICGVKACIVDKAQSILRKDLELISTHPMAGRELSGVKNSTESIFEGANYLIVKTDLNTERGVSFAEEIAKTLKFKTISTVSVSEHDEMIAYLSQLTHCIAISLMNGNDNDELCRFTGDSFRDLTRIANINENLWPELFIDNKEKLIESIDVFVKELNELKDDIRSDDYDALKKKMISSTERRKKFNKIKDAD
jgi:prephenate dehydrogenase